MAAAGAASKVRSALQDLASRSVLVDQKVDTSEAARSQTSRQLADASAALADAQARCVQQQNYKKKELESTFAIPLGRFSFDRASFGTLSVRLMYTLPYFDHGMVFNLRICRKLMFIPVN